MSVAYNWMGRMVGEYIDECGDVNMTELAEDCANALFNREATEEEFELAFKVSEKYKSTGEF